MRIFALALTAAAVSSCTAGPPPGPVAMSPANQERLAALLAGKVAGPPTGCLPTYRSDDMIVIDEHVIAFRDTGRRVYINNMQGGGCLNIDGGRNALVTRTPTGRLCRGDIATVLDTASRMTVGSCVFGDFIPYTTPGG